MAAAPRLSIVLASVLCAGGAPLAAYTLVLTPSSVQVPEGAKSVRFSVTLAGCGAPASQATWVAATEPGPSPAAQAGSDFGNPSPAKFTIGEGATSRVIVVPVLDDSQDEADERFAVVLRPVGSGELVCDQVSPPPAPSTPDSPEVRARITIRDDDAAPPAPFSALGPVGAVEREVSPGDRVELAVRALRSDGSPAAGTVVDWTIQGDATLIGGPASTADANGLATKTVTAGAGEARVTARAGGAREVVFLLRPKFTLDTLFDPAVDPGPASVADALANICRSQREQFSELCGIIGHQDANGAAETIRELTPTEYGTAAQLALEAAHQQAREIWRRQGDLHRRARTQSSSSAVTWNLPVQVPERTRSGWEARETGRAWDGQDRDGLDRLLARALAPAAAQDQDDPADAADEQAGEEAGPWGMFVSGRPATGDRDATRREPALDYDAQGLAVGLDYFASSTWVLGLAADYQDSGGDFGDDGGEISVKGGSLTAYATAVRGGFAFDLFAGAGSSDYELHRRLALPAPPGVLDGRAEPGGEQRTAGVSFGYDRAAGASTWSGFARANWAEVTIDAFLESPTLAGTRLEIFEQTARSLLAEAGLEWTYAASLNWGVLLPQLSASALRELEDEAHLLRGRFVGDSQIFTVPTNVPDRSYFAAAAGLTAVFPGGRSLFVQLEHQFDRDDLSVTTAAGGLRFAF